MKLHEIADHTPLLLVLINQLFRKEEKVFMQRTYNARQALFPLTRAGMDSDSVSLIIFEQWGIDSHMGRDVLIEVEADSFDEKWALSKQHLVDDKHPYWVLHTKNVEPTSTLRSEL